MGKVILCSGVIAENPYIHSETGTYIYTMEELCYYIYHNVDIIDNNFLSEDLAHWVEQEAKLEKRGKRLLELIHGQSNMKDIIVFILCSTDYYTEREIKELIYHMDDYGLLSPYEKKKKDADNHMKYQKYGRALILYEETLAQLPMEEISQIELGDIYHNMGIAKANTKGISSAIKEFQEAYDRNGKEESLLLYLLSLSVTRKTDELNQAIRIYEVKEDMITRVKEKSKLETYPVHPSFDKVYYKLRQKVASNAMDEFFEDADTLVNELKESYRVING